MLRGFKDALTPRATSTALLNRKPDKPCLPEYVPCPAMIPRTRAQHPGQVARYGGYLGRAVARHEEALAFFEEVGTGKVVSFLHRESSFFYPIREVGLS
jgi:hypothetical protein